MLTENLVLALLGGAVGLMVAAGHRLLVTFLTGNFEKVSLEFRLNARLLGFSLALSVLTGLLSGVLPALRAARDGFLPAIHGTLPCRGATRLPFARKGILKTCRGFSGCRKPRVQRKMCHKEGNLGRSYPPGESKR
jgi:hypothetical protein